MFAITMEGVSMRYRRAFVRGGSFFFTVVTHDRQPLFATEEAVATLREAFRRVKAQHPFHLEAMVVLPDHLHCLWILPPEDADFATRWRLIKTWFTKHCAADPVGRVSRSGVTRHPRIWQHRYWEHAIRDETDYSRHLDYIHYNPVKHGLVDRASAWPHSSFRKFVAAGVYAPDWGSQVVQLEDVGRE
jgi:putative transposase